jgi:hypothetical protein
MITGLKNRRKGMHPYPSVEDGKRLGPLRFSKSKMYFSRQSERRFYFILTLIMLVVAIAYNVGFF